MAQLIPEPMDACQDCYQPYVVHNDNPVEGEWPTFKLMNGERIKALLCPPEDGYWCENCKTFHANGYPCPKLLIVGE